jgi:nicotinamide mononucleotide transporter
MNKITTWIRNTFWTGYTPFERAFLYGMLALQLIVFYITPDSPLSMIAGVAGVASVVMCAKGRLEFYFIGFIQNFTYMFLAWQNKFYLECGENLFYIITMIWGIFVWKANMNKNEDGTAEVKAKKFTLVQWALSVVGTIAATIAMGYFGTVICSAQAYTDAATNVMAIFAQILMVRRYREQWIWWLVIDLLNIKMWAMVGDWSMVAMYIAWTANCIYGWVNWSKLNKTNE